MDLQIHLERLKDSGSNVLDVPAREPRDHLHVVREHSRAISKASALCSPHPPLAHLILHSLSLCACAHCARGKVLLARMQQEVSYSNLILVFTIQCVCVQTRMLQRVQQGFLPPAFVREARPAELLFQTEPLHRDVPLLEAVTQRVRKYAADGPQQRVVVERAVGLRALQELHHGLQGLRHELVGAAAPDKSAHLFQLLS